ncbi:MAG TPA: hypothetical protein VFT09_05610 [Ilumatobacteraceae bacterium]|nr:hypothetical protein [Ilumatobacteraceae bacterium]
MPLRPSARRAGLLAAVAACVVIPARPVAAQAPPPTNPPPATALPAAPPTTPAPAPVAGGRQWLTPIPAGCDVPALPDVVFVGTLVETGTPAGAPQETQYETARFRLDQARAGDVTRFSYNGFIDVRYGLDTKDLERGEQYLIGASVDPAAGVLVSTIRLPEPFFGGDDVIAASERDVTCPTVNDPIRTTNVDGTPVDASVVGPFLSSRGRLLKAILLPLGVAFAIVFALVSVRWLITGAYKGVGSVVRTASEPREVRAAMRSRPNVNPDLEDARRH